MPLQDVYAAVDDVGRFYYYNIERDNAGTILI
jgi:hypothetical protein